ncbi:uncharacterized protein LOC143048849 [Mytilus galloprovincialis]|uniref:uncharacterized protein LOC143048849 n=1 Tax=Mytilus galloprovincialis TaxID=29158 RepID=UPI003F7C78A1
MLIPWFFALDHPNYARWLPIHVRDMFALDTIAPSIATEFESGHFVVHKTHSTFSAIAIDHAHEQNNKLVKGKGGVIGLTENASQLLRWMVCGPEMARAVNEFELSQELIKHEQSKGPNVRHHEQVESKQKAFVKQVIALTATIEEMGNPFLEESEDLLVLDTRDIVDPKVANTVRNIEQIGNDKYHEYVRERLDKRTRPLSDPIKQNKLHLFRRQELRSESKEKRQISSLKQNCSLFSQLYVSCQVRDSDLDEFFPHENQAYPPSLSQFGQLRLGSKSDLLVPLEKMCVIVTEIPDVDAIILDGAVIVNILKPRFCKTFEDYSKQVFLPHINNYLKSCSRIDVIWDEYRQDNLKALTRGKRGKGIRRRVQADSTIPGNWESFLRTDDNKTELFAYLAEQLLTLTPSVQTTVVSTKGSEVVCNKPDKNNGNLSPCNHEEADTRILLHVADAVKSGMQKIMIRTVDTDVVVIAVSAVHKLNITSLWMAFGVGKNFRYIPVHEIALFMGPSKSNALLFFHAFSGCDQVSSFSNRGKKIAWDTWLSFDAVTEDFKLLTFKFVVLMYDRTSECLGVDAARKDLFMRKGRSIENMSPSSAALHQHIKRAAYQAGFCWGQALVKLQETPSPSIWGWKRNKEGLWEPFWTALQQASESCAELIKCGCKSENGCRGRCKCVKASLSCTALCKCGGQCDRD